MDNSLIGSVNDVELLELVDTSCFKFSFILADIAIKNEQNNCLILRLKTLEVQQNLH